MISFAFKFCLYFCLSFLILSFPVKQRNLFYHLEHIARPYTKDVFHKVNQVFNEGKKFGGSLFTNANPRLDAVKAQMAAPARVTEKVHMGQQLIKNKLNPAEDLQDHYDKEELEELRNLLKED